MLLYSELVTLSALGTILGLTIETLNLPALNHN